MRDVVVVVVVIVVVGGGALEYIEWAKEEGVVG